MWYPNNPNLIEIVFALTPDRYEKQLECMKFKKRGRPAFS